MITQYCRAMYVCMYNINNYVIYTYDLRRFKFPLVFVVYTTISLLLFGKFETLIRSYMHIYVYSYITDIHLAIILAVLFL